MSRSGAAQAGSGGAQARRVSVIIVNYGPGWDTLECLESVLRLRHRNRQVVVCDNGPDGGATSLLRAWAAGGLNLLAPAEARLRRLVRPPVPKPVRYALYRDAEVEAGAVRPDPSLPLVLIASAANRGFAGGSNLALRYAALAGGADYFWLLNNDTVVEPEALSALLETAEADPAIGLCGSTLLDYHRPHRVQARGGGRYDRWLGRTSLAGRGEAAETATPAAGPALDFVHGASMLVRRAFLDAVGPLEERYFLYFEELDWAARAGGRFRLGYAPGSIVYHKEGGAAGSAARAPALRSRLADRHGIRSRILFTRRFHPWALPTVYLGLLGAMLNRARRRQWDRLPMILRLMIGAGR